MFSRCWVVLASLLAWSFPADSQFGNSCLDANLRVRSLHPSETNPAFCRSIQMLVGIINYRINFTQSTVESICNSAICLDTLQMVVPHCVTFAKKDINCLDSPAVLNTAICPVSETDNTTVCYNSLVNQGVIDIQNSSSPSLLTPCLDAYRDGEDCPTSCYNLLMNADCCFVSYYAFMIDTFVDNDGVPVFKNHTMFVDEFWGWCNLTSTGVCPEVNVMDIARRNDTVTCAVPTPTPTLTPTPTATDTPDAANKPKALHLFILFALLIILIT